MLANLIHSLFVEIALCVNPVKLSYFRYLYSSEKT